jgi:hypothetical protein
MVCLVVKGRMPRWHPAFNFLRLRIQLQNAGKAFRINRD